MTAEVWLINSAHRHSPAILSAPSVTLSPVEARGILHVTNADSRSRLTLHVKFCDRQAVTPFASYPSRRHKRTRPAKLPAYSVLSPASLYAHGIKLRSWQEATCAYLEELRKKGELV
jgi:dTDP-4-dehydrorhamnose reductase